MKFSKRKISFNKIALQEGAFRGLTSLTKLNLDDDQKMSSSKEPRNFKLQNIIWKRNFQKDNFLSVMLFKFSSLSYHNCNKIYFVVYVYVFHFLHYFSQPTVIVTTRYFEYILSFMFMYFTFYIIFLTTHSHCDNTILWVFFVTIQTSAFSGMT